MDFRDSYLPPHRKPVAPPNPNVTGLKPLTPIVPDSQRSSSTQHATHQTHHRSRTGSSSVFPTGPSTAPLTAMAPMYSTQQNASPVSYQGAINQYKNSTRRTLSNATTSTSTTGTSSGLGPARNGSNASASLRRSTSSRSGNSPCGYVALMRKQKATVWCDRSQHEDPRMLAQQKAAKMRAAMEVVGGGRTHGTTSASTGGSMMSRSKIRHHGKPTTVGYTPASLVGGVSGVPMRLSASEVGDEGNRDDDVDSRRAHQRNGSRLSSVSQDHRQSTYLRANHSGASSARYSQASNISGNDSSPDGMSAETPMPNSSQGRNDYFAQGGGNGTSGGSGSSAERESQFGQAGRMPPQTDRALLREKSVKNPDELRRRGSVDDRTMTMSGVRLFVANPDLSD
ncbi:MAG: hypothetical protein M1817_000484 [Caeruleum heppii]|nr:MAG: hypothetical protein M1817_000484 [Caeruleum heppii]